MVHPVAVAGFLVAILPLIATPGASLALLVQYVTEGGRRRALPVVLGTVTGLYVHAALAVAGLSALVMRSSVAFTVVRLIGAVYLIGLGVWTWRTATAAPRRRPRRRTDSVYVQALLANALNPKPASIYLTLTPQFIAPDHPLGGQILTDENGISWSNFEHRETPSDLAPTTGWSMGNAGIIRELLRHARITSGRDPRYAVPFPDHPPTN